MSVLSKLSQRKYWLSVNQEREREGGKARREGGRPCCWREQKQMALLEIYQAHNT